MIATVASRPSEVAAIVLLDLAVIVTASRAMGRLFEGLRQPPVMGELVAGILLGPTLLGVLPGDLSHWLFPPDTSQALGAIGNLGLVIFMFLVGLDLDLAAVARRGAAVGTVSLASVGLPFALGLVLATGLHPGHDHVAGSAVPLLPFALFIATAVSVTAFPVLARILAESGLGATPVGALALAAAAIGDLLAWTLLAVALAIAQSRGLVDLPRILAANVLFATAMVAVVRPLLRHLFTRAGAHATGTPGLLSFAVAGAALSACATNAIGTHFVLGAFLFGAVFPRQGALPERLNGKLAPVTHSVLLPVFFVMPGLALDLGGVGLRDARELVLILAVACAGKFVGAAAAARASGSGWRDAAALGTLMNTRGLMELIVLNVGVAASILDERLYGLFVVMALVTTLMAAPLLRLIYRRGGVPADARDGGAAPAGALWPSEAAKTV